MLKPNSQAASPPERRIGDGPIYELRARALSGGRMSLEVWQLPGPATPRLAQAERTAGLAGRTLEIVEAQVLRSLKKAGINCNNLKPGTHQSYALDEELALKLALLFRTLAPMRNLEKIRQVAQELGKLSREEAGYWLGMAIHRRQPRRVLAALRLLLLSS